jgi:galactokinase/mevalonate kinase-like predicted kinase
MSDGDLPARTGLGPSSSFTVGLLQGEKRFEARPEGPAGRGDTKNYCLDEESLRLKVGFMFKVALIDPHIHQIPATPKGAVVNNIGKR